MECPKNVINPVTEYFSTLKSIWWLKSNGPFSIDNNVEKYLLNKDSNSLEEWLKEKEYIFHDDEIHINVYHALWLSIHYRKFKFYNKINKFMDEYIIENYFSNNSLYHKARKELLLMHKNSNIPFQTFTNLHDFMSKNSDYRDADELFYYLFQNKSFLISWCKERIFNCYLYNTNITTILNTYYHWYYKNFFFNFKSLIKDKRDKILLKERIERCTREYEQVFNMIKLPRDIFEHIVSFIQ